MALLKQFPKEAYRAIPRKREGWDLVKPRPNPKAKTNARKRIDRDFVKVFKFVTNEFKENKDGGYGGKCVTGDGWYRVIHFKPTWHFIEKETIATTINKMVEAQNISEEEAQETINKAVDLGYAEYNGQIIVGYTENEQTYGYGWNHHKPIYDWSYRLTEKYMNKYGAPF